MPCHNFAYRHRRIGFYTQLQSDWARALPVATTALPPAMAGVAIVSSKTGLLQKPQDQMVPPEAVTMHISRFRVKNPLPDRSIDDVTTAYGAWEMPKLVRLLGHSDAITRDKALVSLATMLQKPQLRASGVEAGLVPALISNLSDATLMIRAHAATAFQALAGHPLGVGAIVSQHAVKELVKLLDDKEDIVRSATYDALSEIGQSAAGGAPGEGWSGVAGHDVGGGGGGGAIVDCKGDFSNMTGYVIGKCVTEVSRTCPLPGLEAPPGRFFPLAHNADLRRAVGHRALTLHR